MVKRSEHFEERFSERVCSKTGRQWLFANRAFYLGKGQGDVRDARLRRYIEECEYDELDGIIPDAHKRIVKVYNGQTYIFQGRIAITVFPIPNKLRGLT